MLGTDAGSALIAVLLLRDKSWLTPTLALEGMPAIHTVMALMGDGLLLEIATGAL